MTARALRVFLAVLLAAVPVAAVTGTGEARRLVLVGDSTMAARTGYGDALCRLFRRELECLNLARAGRSTRSFREDGSWERVRALLGDPVAAAGTVVVVQFGHNDQPGKPGRSTDLAREYPANLERYVAEIRAAGARPVLATPLSRRKFLGATIDDDLKPWADAMRLVGEMRRVPLADLHRASIAELEHLGPVAAANLAMPPPDADRTHLGADGASLFAQVMARELVHAVPELAFRLASRPQIGEGDAGRFTMREVLGRAGVAGHETDDPWDPQADPLALARAAAPDFTVDASATADGRSTFSSLQAAVDAALARGEKEGTGRRLHIRVRPGTYAGPVFVPQSRAPILIAGVGSDASAVRIVATIDAAMSGSRHGESFGRRFAHSGPDVAAMAASIRARERVGTAGSAVLWVRSDSFQASNLTIENAYNRAGSDGPAAVQAVALFMDGADRAHFEGVRLLGLQDTVYLRAAAPGRIARSYFHDCLVEGDVDFVFGDGTAYFHRTELRTRGTRDFAYALAPAHHVKARHGFVFDGCRFTHDGSTRALAGRYHLARQWFRGQRCTPYVPRPAIPGYTCRVGEADAFDGTSGTISRDALEAVGKVAILRSQIGAHIDRARPWVDWNVPGTRQYRPVQYHASGYLANLEAAGIDAARELGIGTAELPDVPFLGEYRNVQD